MAGSAEITLHLVDLDEVKALISAARAMDDALDDVYEPSLSGPRQDLQRALAPFDG